MRTGRPGFQRGRHVVFLFRLAKRNKELSILVTVGLYILNIIDANVDAHLLQYNLDDNLTLEPKINYNEVLNKSNFGISLNVEL